MATRSGLWFACLLGLSCAGARPGAAPGAPHLAPMTCGLEPECVATGGDGTEATAAAVAGVAAIVGGAALWKWVFRR